jgi:SH3-like domain-containing protein
LERRDGHIDSAAADLVWEGPVEYEEMDALRELVAATFATWNAERVNDPAKYTQAWTRAEEVYDGFGTQALETVTIGDETWRRVATPNSHVGWQYGRYASGLRSAMTPEQFAEYRQWKEELQQRTQGAA